MSNTIFINLVGGPGCGKTTTAVGLFHELKKSGMAVEFLREPIQRHIYQEDRLMMSKQIPLFGEDILQIYSLDGKVDVVVRDTSLLNNIVYDDEDNPLFHALVIQEHKKLNNIDFFIDRGDIPFQSYGRIHDYEQSLELDNKIKDVYRFANVPLFEVPAETAVEDILEYIRNGGKTDDDSRESEDNS